MHLSQGPTQLITELQLEPMSVVPTVCPEFMNTPKVSRPVSKCYVREAVPAHTKGL